jgi:hypothetical protein
MEREIDGWQLSEDITDIVIAETRVLHAHRGMARPITKAVMDTIQKRIEQYLCDCAIKINQ